MNGLVRELAMRFSEGKHLIADAFGGHLDLLHLPFGLAIFLALLVLLRHRRAPLFLAFTGVAALQILNELMDALMWWIWMQEIPWLEATADTVWTLLVPGLIVLSATLSKRLGYPVDQRAGLK